MTDLVLTPQNDLEECIAAAFAGRMDENAFMNRLWTAEVFMPVNESLSDGRDAQTAVPLSIQAEDGLKVLLLFSGADRAKPVLADMPGVSGGFQTQFGWVIRKMGDGNFGVCLNLGWDLCMDFYADDLQKLMDERPGDVTCS